jgi:uncharacterized membrane protein
MRKFTALAAAAATLLAGSAAFANEKPADAPKAAKEKKICRGLTTSTSRIPAKKVCKTKAEWQQAGNQEDLDDAESRLRGMTRGN